MPKSKKRDSLLDVVNRIRKHPVSADVERVCAYVERLAKKDIAYREANKEAYRIYMRNYMRERRARNAKPKPPKRNLRAGW